MKDVHMASSHGCRGKRVPPPTQMQIPDENNFYIFPTVPRDAVQIRNMSKSSTVRRISSAHDTRFATERSQTTFITTAAEVMKDVVLLTGSSIWEEIE